MRRLGPFVVLLFFLWAPAAGATPTVSASANPALGQAPLDVTLTAVGDGVSYHWNLGDGAAADGPVVQHRYEKAGRYTATVTAVGADGSTAQASVTITAVQLVLEGPRIATYGRRAAFRGRIVPAIPKAGVALYADETAVRSARTDKKGRFRFRLRLTAPASFSARFGGAVSNALAVPLRPGLDVAFPRASMIGRPLVLRAVLRPRGAGTLRLRIWRGRHELRRRTFGGRARLRLAARHAVPYVVKISVRPKGAFRGRSRTVRSSVYVPYLALGARGSSVRVLERRLAQLHYALRAVDGFYSFDTSDAVLAFQKVNGLARTGRMTPAGWRRVQSAHVPRPRYRTGHHLEVDKTRQVLFEVDRGQVVRVVHVSTGTTGNTPVGRWRVYSRVPGFNAIGMFYSSFFLRGFAIHGYHSVPPYPASHGCVRTPIWVAPSLFAASSYGESVYVYH